MENFDSNNAGELNTNGEKPRKINPKVSKIMDIKTFEDGVRKGIINDDKGTAYLILNGTLYTTYNVYIDRRCVTKAGAVVSFEGLLKNYAPEDIQIRYDLKEQRLPSRIFYRESRDKKKK